jgi:hypothetical protein
VWTWDTYVVFVFLVMRRSGPAVCLVAAALTFAALFGVGSSRAAGGPILHGPYGVGAGRVWLLLPRSRPRSVVVFLHGWKVAPPGPSYPWVGQFRPWLDHLAANGSAVVFPVYPASPQSMPRLLGSTRRTRRASARLILRKDDSSRFKELPKPVFLPSG